jgi:hypothetical protein
VLTQQVSSVEAAVNRVSLRRPSPNIILILSDDVGYGGDPARGMPTPSPDRLAARHPEWQHKERFASLLNGNLTSALAGGDKSIAEIGMVTHAGMNMALSLAVLRP